MSIRLLRSAILAALALAPALTPLLAADQPPGNLHWTGDHWTAWELPAAAPEGAKVHVVKPGDTFWALAKQNLGNPYLWPQLWEKNQYVLDAHWIYPGDPLLLDVAVQPAADAATTAEAAPTGDTGAEEAFRRVVELYPEGNKVPDALLKLGVCRELAGDPAGAAAVLRTLIERFPGSEAATLATRRSSHSAP